VYGFDLAIIIAIAKEKPLAIAIIIAKIFTALLKAMYLRTRCV